MFENDSLIPGASMLVAFCVTKQEPGYNVEVMTSFVIWNA